MELTGERHLPADCAAAWLALNDPRVLCACIPGCEALERVADGEYTLALFAVLGPVRAKFRGRLHLEDVVEPRSYTLRFQGEGGAAGLASGTAHVTLSATDSGTLLEYRVSARVAGRIAQVGSRLIDSAALKMAEHFFSAFEKQLGSDSN
jgi:uncharacterized protein